MILLAASVTFVRILSDRGRASTRKSRSGDRLGRALDEVRGTPPRWGTPAPCSLANSLYTAADVTDTCSLTASPAPTAEEIRNSSTCMPRLLYCRQALRLQRSRGRRAADPRPAWARPRSCCAMQAVKSGGTGITACAVAPVGVAVGCDGRDDEPVIELADADRRPRDRRHGVAGDAAAAGGKPRRDQSAAHGATNERIRGVIRRRW